MLTAFTLLAELVGLVEGKELMLGELLGSAVGWGTKSSGERVPATEMDWAGCAVTAVRLFLIPPWPSFGGV